ncbi:MBL fold metallo-hydrolase [Natrarchaeobaculum aegyptiacum]|uniref:MBL fold metallo-hydrolase n=1 Tax=Natrarchaeobaculum aegyptiacum TaxID=745377 RepID=A0A2Z2HPG3_9EURY|nr:MBL fold metallo-hydrolase [Natrarchaeobaculum aegyptiacum]ARS88812.1 MBL fold metallo-hydrolase [Natrarchaeobaculum aegyptiacum]
MDIDATCGVGREQSAGSAVHRLEFDVPWPPKHVAAYLIEGSEPILVDAGGYDSDAETTLREELEQVGYGLADVAHVLITHVHSDHIGQVDALREAGATIHVPAAALERLEVDDSVLREGFERVARSAGYDGDKLEEVVSEELESFERDRRLVAHEETQELEAGQPLEIGGREFRSIETPGHEADHLCFETDLDGERVLFSGDALIESFRAGAFHVGIAPGAYDAVDAYYEAMDRLEGTDAVRAYPGHGQVFEDPQGTVKLTRDRLDELVAGTLEAVAAVEPATPLSIATERVDTVRYIAPVLDTMGALGTLERRGAVTYEVDDGVRYYLDSARESRPSREGRGFRRSVGTED